MKRIVIGIALSLFSFGSFAQGDNTRIELDILFPTLFSDCDDSFVENEVNIIYPLSTDYNGILVFRDVVEAAYSNEKYIVVVDQFDNTTDLISDVWLQITDGDGYNLILVHLCKIHQAITQGILFTELDRVFDYINDNYIKIWGHDKQTLSLNEIIDHLESE
jgi:hypothetical protein